MDKQYIKLFQELTQTTAVLAEQVMDYDHQKDDTKGFETAQSMRDDFQNLHDKIAAEDFDGNLTKSDYAKLLVGAYIVTSQVKERIKILKSAITGYENDLIPALQKIIDSSEEEYQNIATEVLTIESNE